MKRSSSTFRSHKIIVQYHVTVTLHSLYHCCCCCCLINNELQNSNCIAQELDLTHSQHRRHPFAHFSCEFPLCSIFIRNVINRVSPILRKWSQMTWFRQHYIILVYLLWWIEGQLQRQQEWKHRLLHLRLPRSYRLCLEYDRPRINYKSTWKPECEI